MVWTAVCQRLLIKITVCISVRRSCSLKWISPPPLFFFSSNPEIIIHLRSFFLPLEKSRRPKKIALHCRQGSKNYLQINKQLYTTCLYRCFEHKWNPVWRFPCLASSKDQAIYSFITLAQEMKTVFQNESLGRNLCKARVSVPTKQYLTVQLDMDGERTQSAYQRLMVLSICDLSNHHWLFSLRSDWWRLWNGLPSMSVNNSLHSTRRFDVGFIDFFKIECWGWQTEICLKMPQVWICLFISSLLCFFKHQDHLTLQAFVGRHLPFCHLDAVVTTYFSVFSFVFRS